jgi:hypothetical protein
MDNHIVSIFDFGKEFLANDGEILFFHPNDLLILKDIKSYTESYNFQICMKWGFVNFLTLLAQRTLP